MMKLMGSLCVFAAGGIAWYLQRREEQRKRLVLAELTAALRQMETEIRLARTALPQLLEQLAEGRCKEVSAFWMSVSRDLTAGRRPLSAWRRALGGLGLSPEDTRALLSLPEAMQGDETSACKGISLARKTLQNSLEQMEARRPGEEKRATALCFSAAALVVVLLI